MPGCVIDIDAHVDSDWGRIRFQDFERSRLCFVLSGLVISDHGKTAKYVLRCYTCQLLGCVFWVYFVASPLDWGKGGGWVFGLGYPGLGWGSFSFYSLGFGFGLGFGLVISHCVMISRCSLLRGLRRRTFGYTCSRGYQFIEIPFWADHFLLTQVFS